MEDLNQIYLSLLKICKKHGIRISYVTPNTIDKAVGAGSIRYVVSMNKKKY